MIEKETAAGAPPIGSSAGEPSFEVLSMPDGSALITVTYGTTQQTLQLPIDDLPALADAVNSSVICQPAPLPAP
jgi:hypothetical protein